MTLFGSGEHTLDSLSRSDEGSRKINVTTECERKGSMSDPSADYPKFWKKWLERDG